MTKLQVAVHDHRITALRRRDDHKPTATVLYRFFSIQLLIGTNRSSWLQRVAK